MIEKGVEMPVVTRAQKGGWFVRKVQWGGRIGAPDRVFIRCGRVVWIEFKRPGGKPRLSQTLEIDRMKAAGAEVYWCDSVGEAMSILSQETEIDRYRAALERIATGSNDARREAQEALGWI